ncbi:MAG: PKD domain-containing protein, partial [Bacteroidota bacterium]
LAFIAKKDQSQIFLGRSVQTLNTRNLEKQFHDYDLYQIDVNAIDAFAKSGATDIDFKLLLGNDYDWDFSITPVDVRSENYTLTTERDGKLVQLPVGENLTFRGSIQDHSSSLIALTLDEGFMYGFVRIGKEDWYIEPLWYFNKNAPRDQIVVYKSSDVRWDRGHTCGAMETRNRKKSFGRSKPNIQHQRSRTSCYEVDLAIASDRAMFDAYSTVEAVEAHNIAVNNNVITDYDNDFVHELDFSIVTQFVVTDTVNPWGINSGTPIAFSLLDAFKDWGNDGGFGVDYDLASVWTNLDFQGTLIGIANIGQVCSSWRYNALQDFSSNAALLRVLTSHEYGHNLDGEHDDSITGTIMSRGVSNTTNWSAESIADIDAYIISRINSGCLTACTNDPPLSAPTADFTSENTTGCAPLSVQFIDESSATTTAWTWSFEQGTPASSTEQNPTVVYSQQGSFEVSLIAANPAGNDTISQTVFIEVEDLPTASFETAVDFTTVNFNNTSLGGNSYVWDFGDGNFSTNENPVHIYESPDLYTVTLTVTNDCGANTFTETLEIIVSNLEEISEINTFSIFPNPTASASFTLALRGKPLDNLRYQVFNVIGQELDREQLDFKSGNLVQQFDYQSLAKGVYIIR